MTVPAKRNETFDPIEAGRKLDQLYWQDRHEKLNALLDPVVPPEEQSFIRDQLEKLSRRDGLFFQYDPPYFVRHHAIWILRFGNGDPGWIIINSEKIGADGARIMRTDPDWLVKGLGIVVHDAMEKAPENYGQPARNPLQGKNIPGFKTLTAT